MPENIIITLATMETEIKKTIAILGCGWLGLPLAKHLVNQGYQVKGSTTTSDKTETIKACGIQPFLIRLGDADPDSKLEEFLNVELLIINIPPGRSTGSADNYVSSLKQLKPRIAGSPVKKIIFISSTSVYAENNSIQTEESNACANSASGLRMQQSEGVFQHLTDKKYTVIRMAGLIGPNRHPGRFFAGKKDLPEGLVPVNLIHLSDCIGIIDHVIKKELWNETFNAAAPDHPEKMKFYNLASQKLYGQSADFIAEKGNFKIVSSEKIIASGYQFKYPGLMAWLEEEDGPQS